MDIEVMKQAVVDALEDIKGYEITVMDVRKLTSMATYMIIANASSTRQAKALADHVRGQRGAGNRVPVRGADQQGVHVA